MTKNRTQLRQNRMVQHNSILDGTYRFGVNEYKLIYFFVSLVDSRKSQNENGYSITVKQFREVFDVDEDNNAIYDQLRTAVKNIIRTPVAINKGINKRGNPIIEEIAWAGSITYEQGNGEFDSYISMKFSREIEPYLFNLQCRFTSVVLEHIARLNTSFSMRLYLWLKERSMSGKHKNIEIDIEWMKERAELQNKYERFSHFKLRIIDPSVERINNNTDLNITYTLNKDGKSYKSITFKLNSKSVSGKLKRERLPRRPKVKSGSDAEGKWARECISVLAKHQKEIAKDGDWLDVADIKRLISCHKIIGNTFQVNAWEKYSKRRSADKNKSTNNGVDSLIKSKEEFHYNENGIKIDEDGIPLFED